MSNNLNISQVSAGQLQKDVTINEQAGQLDAAFTEQFEIAGDANPVLTSDEFAHNIVFNADGTQTGLTTLTVLSSQKKMFLVSNLDNAFDLDVVKGATTITVVGGTSQVFYSDGTTDGLVEFVPEAQQVIPVISWFAEGVYGALEIVSTVVASTAMTLPANLVSSQAYAEVAPTGAVSITIKLNGVSIGTIDFAAAANAGTFTFTTEQALIAGDVLTFEAPGGVDGTFADVSVTIITV